MRDEGRELETEKAKEKGKWRPDRRMRVTQAGAWKTFG